MTLSTDQRSAIEQGDAVPIHVDQTECVVLRKDIYEAILKRTYDDSQVDVRGAYPLMDAAAKAAGWDDPAEDLYDDLAPRSS